MNTYYYDKEFMKTSLYQEFIQNNQGSGNLKIRAYAAREALPLEGLHIVVSTKYLDNTIIFFDGYTDSSGMIEKLILPAPVLNQDNLIIPLSTIYEIKADDIMNSIDQKFSVSMYDGVCVVQNINFIPESGVENNVS